jgi:phosphoglycerol geranylgeranyltransferase
MIRAVRHYVDVPMIVGGGIRSREQALAAASAGADIIVTGNVVEESGMRRRVSEIIEGIKRGRA